MQPLFSEIETTLTDHFMGFTLPVQRWTPFAFRTAIILHDRFNKTLETFIIDSGGLLYLSVVQESLQASFSKTRQELSCLVPALKVMLFSYVNSWFILIYLYFASASGVIQIFFSLWVSVNFLTLAFLPEPLKPSLLSFWLWGHPVFLYLCLIFIKPFTHYSVSKSWFWNPLQ